MALPLRVHLPRLAAGVLMIGTGITSLIMTLLDQGAVFAAVVLGQPFPGWFSAHPWQPWPVCQSVLVIVGGLGGMTGVFTLTAVGILAGLVFTSPVGLLTALPSVLLLLSALLRLRAFYEFMPRWRGPGPRPPGPEYR
jgi:hypothetical protein